MYEINLSAYQDDGVRECSYKYEGRACDFLWLRTRYDNVFFIFHGRPCHTPASLDELPVVGGGLSVSTSRGLGMHRRLKVTG